MYPRVTMRGEFCLKGREPQCTYVVNETADEVYSVELYSGYVNAGLVEDVQGLTAGQVGEWLLARLDY